MPKPSALSPSHPHKGSELYLGFPLPSRCQQSEKILWLKNLLPIIAVYFTFLQSNPWMRMECLKTDHCTWNYIWIKVSFCSTLLSKCYNPSKWHCKIAFRIMSHFRPEVSHRTPQNKFFRRKTRKHLGWLCDMTQNTGKCKDHVDTTSFYLLWTQSPKFYT